MDIPEVRYFESSSGAIAYQTFGEGPDVVFLAPVPQNLDMQWEQPAIERFLRRLASFCRLTIFDWVGLSDGVGSSWSPTSEDFLQTCREVVDHVEAERVTLIGIDPPATTTAWFAASYPDRVSSIVLIDPAAKWLRSDDYPWGMPEDMHRRWVEFVVSKWGTGELLTYPNPTANEQLQRWYAKYERATFSPIAFRRFVEGSWRDADLRGVLGSISCPTLIIAHEGHTYIRPEHSEYLARQIPHARLIKRPGHYGIWWLDDTDATLDEIEAFITGGERSTASADRVLATVLFTDIVDSTKRAASLGDARWRELLDIQSSVWNRQLERFSGRLVNTAGDGLLATFDGPARAIRCGLGIRDEMRAVDLDIRTGVHTGEVEMRGSDIGGLAVHVGARVMGEADPGGVMVTSIVKDLVAGSGIVFEERGARELKGVPEPINLFAVANA